MIDVEQSRDNVKISYIGKDGNRAYKYYNPRKKWRWEYTTPTDPKRDRQFKSWDGRNVKRDFSKFFDHLTIHEFLDTQKDSHELFEYNKPRMHFCDIEVISKDDKFPKPEEVKWEVNTIAVVNQDGICIILGDKPLTKSEIDDIEIDTNKHFEGKGFKNSLDFKVKYVYFARERELLEFFWRDVMPKITLLTGWYFIDFDWTYLVNRSRKKGIDIEGLMGTKLFGEKQLPRHTLVVDYLEIYKKWDTSVKIKENDQLDYVAEQALGVRKIKFKGSFRELYENDYKKFVLYNNIDSALLYFLDESLNTMTTFLKIGLLSNVPHQKAFKAVPITETFYFKELYKHNLILLKDTNVTPSREKYEGAYVRFPEVGLHEDVVAFDFASLYPRIMIQFMISPEFFMGMVNDKDEERTRMTIHKIYKEVFGAKYDKGEVTEMIDLLIEEYGEENCKEVFKVALETVSYKYIMCCSGAVFENNPKSAFPTILESLYGKRKIAKKKMFECDSHIDYLEHQLELV